MKTKVYAGVLATLFTLGLTACGDQSAGFSGGSTQFNLGALDQDGDLSDIISPKEGDDLVVEEPSDEDRATPPTEEDPAEGKVCLTVRSLGVSSARVYFNDTVVLSESDFDGKDFEKTLEVELLDENTLDVTLRGRPETGLYFGFFDCSKEEPELIQEFNITRAKGAPNNMNEKM